MRIRKSGNTVANLRRIRNLVNTVANLRILLMQSLRDTCLGSLSEDVALLMACRNIKGTPSELFLVLTKNRAFSHAFKEKKKGGGGR